MSLVTTLIKSLARLTGVSRGVVFDESDLFDSVRPGTAGIEILNTCNAKCSFCGYGKQNGDLVGDPRPKGKMETALFQHCVDLYGDAGGGSFQIGPILGENTVHPQWLEFIRIARAHPRITGVNCYSNGILLDRFGFEEILTSGLSNLSISFSPGSPEQYQRLYGVDKYDQVISNILAISEANHRLGNPVTLNLLARIDKPYEAFLDSELHRRLTRFLPPTHITILQTEWDDYRGLVTEADLPQGHRFKREKWDRSLPCYGLFRKLQVLYDGTLQNCSCRVEPELWGGRIQDYETLEAAWRDPKRLELIQQWRAGTVPGCCHGCSHYHPFTILLPANRKAMLRPLVPEWLLRLRRRLMGLDPVPPPAPVDPLI